ncbi:dirigent protein 24-like [Zingiber officinale]|uniref:dirigent protein 24-like n=1 Tax=Zingiber officinale TaxID=94328 RepID=UPI001C4D60E7|nr:dirigent protein 24-like [Zingiber officinale]
MLKFIYPFKPLLLVFLFWFSIKIDISISMRILSHKTSTFTTNGVQTITFLMNDILGSGQSSSKLHSGSNDLLQPPKPMNIPIESKPLQTYLTNGWLPILARSQALEVGKMAIINEKLMGDLKLEQPQLGQVQGLYVTRMEGGNNSFMVTLRVSFTNVESEESLNLFGAYQPALPESHIAVVGGTGRFEDANGVARLKAVELTDNIDNKRMHFRVLAVDVYFM